MSTESITFEQSLQRLDEIVRRMEKGDVPLEEALSLFEARGWQAPAAACWTKRS